MLLLRSLRPRLTRLAAIETICVRRLSMTVRLDKLDSVPDNLQFANPSLQKYLETLRQEFYALRESASSSKQHSRMYELNGIVSALEQHRAISGNMATKRDISNEHDPEMRALIEEENSVYSDILRKTEEVLMKQLFKLYNEDTIPSLNFEVNAGAGGQEARLFARDLYEMYTNFFNNHKWDYKVIAKEIVDIGGLRHANILVEAPEAYPLLRHEAGIHRVQRVPATEKAGRMHTSTVSVAVIPRPADIHFKIEEKDLKIETKRASGAGGQHVNTTDSAVRIVHLPTGISVEVQSERSQIKNRAIAMSKLYDKLMSEKQNNVTAEEQATRKLQQGNLDRNEKIRTYNFVQDRVTDHRLQGGTVHDLDEFMYGGPLLEMLIKRLVLDYNKKKLSEIVASYEKTEKKSEPVGEKDAQPSTNTTSTTTDTLDQKLTL